jgi:hypothetical protein
MNQKMFHIGLDQALPRVASAGPVFGPPLGPVSPVFDVVPGQGVSLYLPADGEGASAQEFGDRADVPALFQRDGDLLPLGGGQMGIFVVELAIMALLLFDEVVGNTIIRVLPFFCSPCMGRL